MMVKYVNMNDKYCADRFCMHSCSPFSSHLLFVWGMQYDSRTWTTWCKGEEEHTHIRFIWAIQFVARPGRDKTVCHIVRGLAKIPPVLKISMCVIMYRWLFVDVIKTFSPFMDGRMTDGYFVISTFIVGDISYVHKYRIILKWEALCNTKGYKHNLYTLDS